jgi:hypothetical protein
MFKNIVKFKIYKLSDFKLIKTNYYLNFTRKAKKDVTIADGLEIINKKIEKLDGVNYCNCDGSKFCANCQYYLINDFVQKPCCVPVLPNEYNHVFIPESFIKNMNYIEEYYEHKNYHKISC